MSALCAAVSSAGCPAKPPPKKRRPAPKAPSKPQPPRTDEFESNDTWESAKEIKAGTHEKLVALGGNDGSKGLDHYSIQLPAFCSLKVKIEASGENEFGPPPEFRVTHKGGPDGRYPHFELKPDLEQARSVQFRVEGDAGAVYTMTVEVRNVDASEPNDTAEDATLLDLAKPPSDLRVQQGEDWYRCEVAAKQRVRLQLRPQYHPVELELHEANQGVEVLWDKVHGGQQPTREIILRATQDGSLRFFTKGKAGAKYQLSAAQLPPEPFEPNEDRAGAKPLNPGSYQDLQLMGEDWYVFEIPAGKAAELKIDGGPNGRPDSRLYGDSDKALVENVFERGYLPKKYLDFDPGSPRKLYLRISSPKEERGKVEGIPYELRLTLRKGYEPNQEAKDAKALPPYGDDGKGAKLSGMALEVGDEADWFRMPVKAGQTAMVKVSTSRLYLGLMTSQGEKVGDVAGKEWARWRATQDSELLIGVMRADMDSNRRTYELTYGVR